MMYTIVSLWITLDARRPRSTLAWSPPLPGSWRGLVRCSIQEWRELAPGRITSLALSLS